MEFIVSSAALLKGLVDVSKAIPSKTALPILENFLFVLADGKLEVTASDQELTLRTIVEPTSIVEEGSIVPARQLVDLLKALPDQPITIKTTSDGTIECKWSNGNSTLPYFPAADYPEIKGTTDDAQTIVFPAETFTSAIASTIYATADDEMRPTLNGIFFDICENSTTLVASDQHKLICYTCPDVTAQQKASFILHKKSAAVLKSIISREDETVEVSFDANNIVFKFGSTTMISRLIIGKYPSYRNVIPQNNSNILKIDRIQLLNTVRRVAVCANKASNHIKMDLAPGQIEITAQDYNFALAAYEKIECDYSGTTFSIGFKSSFIIEILSNINCETIVMKFADGHRAALIVPSEEEEAAENICGILMPIMVS